MIEIGGLPLPMLVERVGQTPFYAYDRARIQQRIDALRAALPPQVLLHYAVKANPMPALVGWLATRVDGFDVASGGELKVALDAGASPADIGFAGPAKREVELRQAVAAGVLVNAESLRELRVLARVAEQLERPARVALRVNPDFALMGAGLRMGGGAQPFGIDAEAVPEALAQADTAGLRFEGLHLYAGSQNLNAEAICSAQTQSYELALRLLDAPARERLRVLNLGGGFGIPYHAGDMPLELAPIATNLAALVERARIELPNASLVLELGRHLVGEAGFYVTRVVDRKVSRGRVFLVTDGGLNHHLAATGRFGVGVRRPFPIAVVGRHQTKPPRLSLPPERVTIAGPSCTPLDRLAEDIELPPADIGDFIVVLQSGAYGATASPQAFLGHPACVEVLV